MFCNALSKNTQRPCINKPFGKYCIIHNITEQPVPLTTMWEYISQYTWDNNTTEWVNMLLCEKSRFVHQDDYIENKDYIYVDYKVSDVYIPSLVIRCIRALIHHIYKNDNNMVIDCMCQIAELLFKNTYVIWLDYLDCVDLIVHGSQVSANILLIIIRSWIGERGHITGIPSVRWLPIDNLFCISSELGKVKNYIPLDRIYKFTFKYNNYVIYFTFMNKYSVCAHTKNIPYIVINAFRMGMISNDIQIITSDNMDDT
jgi:hypothetical protein